MNETAPKIFRITVEVANLEDATKFYADLLGVPGQRHPGARHYFDCGGVILAVLDVTEGGMKPAPGGKSIYFAVDDIDGLHARALETLAPFHVHGQPAGDDTGADPLRRRWEGRTVGTAPARLRPARERGLAVAAGAAATLVGGRVSLLLDRPPHDAQQHQDGDLQDEHEPHKPPGHVRGIVPPCRLAHPLRPRMSVQTQDAP